MARFNINTFSPVYPESNDKRGEVQIVQIIPPEPVDENYSPEMRLDYLPVFLNDGNTWAVGRQTIYRTVISDNVDLPWSEVGSTDEFLEPNGVNTTTNLPFRDFIISNVRGYVDRLNNWLSENTTTTIQITKVHVIGSNIQFSEKGSDHVFFHTYDVIFYGQQSPNPYIEPTPAPPPCEVLSGYTLNTQFPNPPSNTKVAITVPTPDTGRIILKQRGAGVGISAVTVQFGLSSTNPIFNTVGETFSFSMVYTPIPAGDDNITGLFYYQKTSGAVGIPFTLNSSGVALLGPVPVIAITNQNLRLEFQPQTKGTIDVQIDFQCKTVTCLV